MAGSGLLASRIVPEVTASIKPVAGVCGVVAPGVAIRVGWLTGELCGVLVRLAAGAGLSPATPAAGDAVCPAGLAEGCTGEGRVGEEGTAGRRIGTEAAGY